VSAVFSECRTWRYSLARWTAQETHEFKTVAFIGLNPSTADEVQDDPTVRRCVGFAKAWGFDRLVMLNAFAFRATDPGKLAALDFSTAVGPENHKHLVREARAADLVVCAWGVHGARWQRGPSLALALGSEPGISLHVLGLTKDGHPRHPLYLRADLQPVLWEGYA
jgi:hypothetical protein